MKFTVKSAAASAGNKTTESVTDPSAGHHDEDQPSILFGEDLTSLQEVGALEDGQPSAATEGLELQGLNQQVDNKVTGCVCHPGAGNIPPPCMSRVIDEQTKQARITVVLGAAERRVWLGQIIGLIDSASENDVIDITIDACGHDSVYDNRSLLSAIERCKGTVITHAGFLTTLGDVALWLAGDELKWSKHMTAIMIRQQVYGYGGDVRDFVSKADDAYTNFKEFSSYISQRGLFTAKELDTMYETRGMLSLHGRELYARMASLKQVD